jgi:hypothetical protein
MLASLIQKLIHFFATGEYLHNAPLNFQTTFIAFVVYFAFLNIKLPFDDNDY